MTPILVNHTVPTAGFIVQDRSSAFVYSGDTCVTDNLWDVARRVSNLKAVLIECSYPNGMEDLTRLSKHLTPHLLVQEWKKLSRPELPVYAYHLKPIYEDQIISELATLGIPVSVLHEGQIIEI